MAQIVDLNKAYAEVYAKLEATIMDNPAIVKCFSRYENTLENKKKAHEREMYSARHSKFINMDTDTLEDMYQKDVLCYKRRFANYMQQDMHYLTKYISIEDRKKINKKYNFKILEVD